MKKTLLLCATFLTAPFIACAGDAAQADLASIKKNIPELPITTTHPTPIDGLFELPIKIQNQTQIFYTNSDGTILIAQGHMFDTQSKKDLTKDRLAILNPVLPVDWNTLPLDAAIVSGDPKGMEVAIFTDPDCPFCRRLEMELAKTKGVKVYTFLLPLTSLHPHAAEKSQTIWCSSNQHQALTEIMIEDKELTNKTCDNPLAKIAAIAQSLDIHGTPTLIAKDGRKTSGALPANDLEAWLKQGATK
ncbi:MAG: DsbC family protein [Zetaproteobacteria bacterium]|nr:DsbC family protein [Zetaproteobacteria bacterium]